MTDLATLGLAVDSSGLATGSAALKDFSATAKTAGAAADDFNQRTTTNMDRVNQTMKTLGDTHDRLSLQSQSLFHAMRGMTEQLLLGVPPTQALTAQINHLSYAASGEGGLAGAFTGVTGILSRAGSALGAFVTPVTAAAAVLVGFGAGAVAMAASFSSSQWQVENSLRGIGRLSGTTASDINSIALATANTSTLTVSGARDIATAFAATGKISRDNIAVATGATQDMAKVLGIDAVDAAKMLGAALANPAKGVDELNAKLGAFDNTTRGMIDRALRFGDVMTAQALIIKGVKDATEGATQADQKWYEFITSSFGNAGKTINQAIAIAAPDQTRQQQIGALQARQQNLLNAPVSNFNNSPAELTAYYAALAQVTDQLNKLREAARSADLKAWNEQLSNAQFAADSFTKALVPQIDQVDKLDAAIIALKRAQNIPDAQGNQGAYNAAALTAAENQKQLVTETIDETIRYNERLKDTSAAYEGIGLKTAQVLSSLERQLPVVSAVTEAERQRAQYEVTVQALMDEGKTAQEAQMQAGLQFQISQTAATAAIERQTQSIRNQNDLLSARNLKEQQAIAARQAYDNAVNAGADDQAALDARNAVYDSYQQKIKTARQAQHEADLAWQADMLGISEKAQQIAISIAQAADAEEAAARAAHDAQFTDPGGSFGDFTIKPGKQYVSGGGSGGYVFGGDQLFGIGDTPLRGDQFVSSFAANAVQYGGGVPGAIGGLQSIGFNGGYGTLDSLYQLLNTNADNTTKLGNLQAELTYLQLRPETLERDQSIANLISSINSLQQQTAANTQATTDNTQAVQATLNPLYSEGHGALQTPQIGYYQAASGLDLDVTGGMAGVDSVPIHIMAQQGERVRVYPPGSREGSGAPVINQYFDQRGTSTNQQRLSTRQVAQAVAAVR